MVGIAVGVGLTRKQIRTTKDIFEQFEAKIMPHRHIVDYCDPKMSKQLFGGKKKNVLNGI